MMDEIKKNEYAAAKMRTNVSNIIFDIIIYIVLAFVVISTVYPFWNTIAISLNDGWIPLKVELSSSQENSHGRTIRICSRLHVFSRLELFRLLVQFFRLF